MRPPTGSVLMGGGSSGSQGNESSYSAYASLCLSSAISFSARSLSSCARVQPTSALPQPPPSAPHGSLQHHGDLNQPLIGHSIFSPLEGTPNSPLISLRYVQVLTCDPLFGCSVTSLVFGTLKEDRRWRWWCCYWWWYGECYRCPHPTRTVHDAIGRELAAGSDVTPPLDRPVHRVPSWKGLLDKSGDWGARGSTGTGMAKHHLQSWTHRGEARTAQL